MTILTPTAEELEIIEEARQIAPLKEDWYIGPTTTESFCNWKYILLGIDPKEFPARYGNLDKEINALYSLYDNIRKELEGFDRCFYGYHNNLGKIKQTFVKDIKEAREISIKKGNLLKKMEPILTGALNLMMQHNIEGDGVLPQVGAYVLEGENLQLKFHTPQCWVTSYNNNWDLYATALGYVVEWYTHIKNVYPDLLLRLPAEAIKNSEFLRIHSINFLKSENLLKLFIPLAQGKIKDVVWELFLQVLKDALRSCNINEECVTLYIARDLFALFAGIKIGQNGTIHNPNGNTLKKWSFKTVNNFLKPHFSQGMEKTKDQRDERDRIIENLKDYIVSSKESSVVRDILKSVKS